MDELKSCPFCGSKAELTGECDMVWVRCTNYDCRAEKINRFDEPEDAIKDWNVRKLSTAFTPEQMEQYRKNIKEKQEKCFA